MNTLYYGDNLNILRDYIKNESIDLIYLDPPTKQCSKKPPAPVFYHSYGCNKDFPKIQILTVEELFEREVYSTSAEHQ